MSRRAARTSDAGSFDLAEMRSAACDEALPGNVLNGSFSAAV